MNVLHVNHMDQVSGGEKSPLLRPLMLGKGWFPDQLGGLDRYYRDLLEHMPEASGIVIGGGSAAHVRVTGVSGHERPLMRRLLAFWRATQLAADRADVVDVHFALYALAPLRLGRLRAKPVDPSLPRPVGRRERRGRRRLGHAPCGAATARARCVHEGGRSDCPDLCVSSSARRALPSTAVERDRDSPRSRPRPVRPRAG